MNWCLCCNLNIRKEQEDKLISLIRNSVSIIPPDRYDINVYEEGSSHRNLFVVINRE